MASRNWIGLAGLVAITAAFSVSACGGTKDDTDTTETGGTSGTATGGSSASGGSSSASTSSSSGGAGTTDTSVSACAVTDPLPDGVTCDAEPVSCNALMTDFSEVAAGAYNGTSFAWGTAATLTGGAFFYDDDASAVTLTVTVANEEAEITGTVPANSYAGFGFWFGPACNDARHYSGISFDIRGTLNAELQIQLQTSRNYPIDTENNKGECEGGWGATTCQSNSKTFGSELVLTDEAQTVQLAWEDFSGGFPVTSVEPSELVGFQWHFNCGDTGDCASDVIIDNVTFY